MDCLICRAASIIFRASYEAIQEKEKEGFQDHFLLHPRTKANRREVIWRANVSIHTKGSGSAICKKEQ
jgi:hypothetical protein